MDWEQWTAQKLAELDAEHGPPPPWTSYKEQEMPDTTDARYYSITLERDWTERPGTYQLKFSTGPGMSTVVGDLRMGDLDALAGIIADREHAASVGPLVAAPRKPHPGEPCAHCHGVGSGCQCDVSYIG